MKQYLLILICTLPIVGHGQRVKDIEGNVYGTITSNSNTWMAENLRTTRLNDGTAIPLIENGEIWEKISTPAYCWLFNDERRNKDIGILSF